METLIKAKQEILDTLNKYGLTLRIDENDVDRWIAIMRIQTHVNQPMTESVKLYSVMESVRLYPDSERRWGDKWKS